MVRSFLLDFAVFSKELESMNPILLREPARHAFLDGLSRNAADNRPKAALDEPKRPSAGLEETHAEASEPLRHATLDAASAGL